MVASLLFAISSPSDPAWRSTTGSAHIAATQVLRTKVATLVGHPVVAFVLYAVLIPITHLTVWYNYTLTHETVPNAEHLAFLVVGYLFWCRSSDRTPTATACTRPCSSSTCSWPSRSTPSPACRWPEPPTNCSRPTSPPIARGFPPQRRRPPRGRRHHVGRRRHPHALADNVSVPALRWMHMDERKAVGIHRGQPACLWYLPASR